MALSSWDRQDVIVGSHTKRFYSLHLHVKKFVEWDIFSEFWKFWKNIVVKFI